VRTAGTKAAIEATIALSNKALGYPRQGREVGKGCHVSGAPVKRSLGMVDTVDLDGNVTGQHEAFETLPYGHVPFRTKTWDRPRKHPTRKEWDCAALDPVRVKAPLLSSEREELAAKYAAAKPATKDWEPVEVVAELDSR